jgi:hypothetical protein
MSNGGTCRINEFRRIGHPGTERMSLFGTEGCFEDSSAGKVWVTKDHRETTAWMTCWPADARPRSNMDGMWWTERIPTSSAPPPSTTLDRLPREFAGLTNGHQGSHQFLVDDFVRGCVRGRPVVCRITSGRPPAPSAPASSPTNPPAAAANCLKVPDFGDPPASH